MQFTQNLTYTVTVTDRN